MAPQEIGMPTLDQLEVSQVNSNESGNGSRRGIASWRWPAVLCAALLVTAAASCSSSGGASTSNAGSAQTSSTAAQAAGNSASPDANSGQATSASGQPSASDFYKGKTITLVVAGSAGGNMDVTARLIASELQKAVGASAVKIVDVHGAGGVIAFNQIWGSPHDGYTIGYGSMATLITTALATGDSVKYDAGKFVYIGRAALLTPRVLGVSAKSGVKDVAGLQAKSQVVFSAQGFNDDFYTDAAIVKTLGLKAKFVTGFANAAAENEALGNGTTTALESSLSEESSLIKSNLAIPVVMLNDKPVEGFENVPLWVDSVSADMKPLAQSFQSVLDMGRSFIAPPGFPAEAAATLSAGLATALQSSDLKTKMDKLGVGISYLSSSDEQAAAEQSLDVLKKNVAMMTDAKKEVQKG